MDKRTINIKIDGKAYPLKIEAEKEKLYRDAANKLNECILKYHKQFAHSVDRTDIFAMAAFNFALKSEELEQELDFDPIAKEVEAMTAAIESYL
ncbi:MAG: cell division protein ZapA [Bacteroidales bacterium]